MTDTADTAQQGADAQAAPDDPAPAAAPYKPAHVLSSDPPEPEPDKPADDPPPRPEKTAEEKARERDNRRYAQAQAQRYAERARADKAEEERARLAEEVRQLRNPGQAAPPQPDLDRLVAQRAEALVAQRDYAAREQRFADAGTGDYGAEEFNERCNVVANLASPAQRSVLMQVVTDMDDGHKAVAALADDPREAERVLAMPPHRMALALAKLAAAPAATATLLRAAAPAVPVSRAPAPITPPAGGRARGEPDPAGSFDEYLRWSAKNIRER